MTTPSSAPHTSRLLLAAVAVGSLALGAGITYTLVRRGAAPAGAAPAATTEHAQAGHSTPAAEASAPGPQRVLISPARQQTIGVRTAIVGHQSMDSTIRTVGAMAYDETRITEVHPKIAGWVERTFVDYVGKTVRRGQPLLTIYSPELVSTQHEYLLALRARGQLSKSAFAETRSGAESLLEATRDRLRLWDVSDAQVEALERTGEVQRTLTLYSPFNGVVLERNTYAGQYITPDTATAKIADLSRIWVVAQIFEYETRSVRLGQEALIEFPYGQSTRKLTGKITFIYPDIDPQTRRARVRIEFANPGLELKPETYVTVTIQVAGGHALAVPREAVIDTGTAQYVIVALADGYFEPRPVEVGAPVDAFYPVLTGLAEGDRIVTSAQFLIDSETNLQAAMQAMSLSMPGMDMGGATRDLPAKGVGGAGADMPGMDMSPKPGAAPGNATPPPPHQHQ
ncbi:MAG: efflux RND transporter periplasmic adaptor subunit [Vicinamibacterales bacterium]|jgi:RND family efflux transporter MFP subunit